MIDQLNADVLVVGGGTGGVAAALQAARRGANTILVSEFTQLGGMLTSAGVSAPDGNELIAFQTGLWGAFLQELKRRHPKGLDWGWVSFFTFDPRVGAEIFADWVLQQPKLQWISGYKPLEVLKHNHKITGVRFSEFTVYAEITVDATELGDLLALGSVPYRWGWELQTEWEEPSAPIVANSLTKSSPVQAPTWVAILQDFGENAVSPEIPAPQVDNPNQFVGAWEGYTPEQFLNYGRLPGGLMMINWPCRGNDYGENLDRLIQSPAQQQQFFQESRWHTQSFVRFIQMELGRRYGLAVGTFPPQQPTNPINLLDTSFALHLYYRESRRLQGLTTIREQDILPMPGGNVATLPINYTTGECDAIAIGNYPNDHHYTQGILPVKQKYLRWGGRWTGTPFTIPYRALIPQETDGLLVCEKNISVSHIANGATRLQPVVLGIGQAAGMAAALCVEYHCQPRELPSRQLQQELLHDPVAPAAIIPLFNLPPNHPNWLDQQCYYLQHPEAYPASGYCHLDSVSTLSNLPISDFDPTNPTIKASNPVNFYPEVNPKLLKAETEELENHFSGIVHHRQEQDYTLTLTFPPELEHQTWTLVTLYPEIDQQLKQYLDGSQISLKGRLNQAGHWLMVSAIDQSQWIIPTAQNLSEVLRIKLQVEDEELKKSQSSISDLI